MSIYIYWKLYYNNNVIKIKCSLRSVRERGNMNILKVLEKAIDNEKTLITADGNMIAEDEIKKAATKEYLAGIKSGEISAETSLAAYMKEAGEDMLTVKEVIDFIVGTTDDEETAE